MVKYKKKKKQERMNETSLNLSFFYAFSLKYIKCLVGVSDIGELEKDREWVRS